MGLLRDYIDRKAQKERDDKFLGLEAYKYVLSAPDAKPQEREWAYEQMMKTGGVKGQERGVFDMLFSPLIHRKPGQGQQQPQRQPEQGPGVPAEMGVETERREGTGPDGLPQTEKINKPTMLSPGEPPSTGRLYSPGEMQQMGLSIKQQMNDLQLQLEKRQAVQEAEVGRQQAEITRRRNIQAIVQDPNLKDEHKQAAILAQFPNVNSASVLNAEKDKPVNLQVGWARTSDGKLIKTREDPRKPGVLYDADTGELVSPGTRSINPTEESARIRQDSYGAFGNFYRAAKGRGASEEEARKIAGDMVYRQFGVQIAHTEQDIAIKAELSGIGGGTGRLGTPLPTAPPVAAPATPSAPALGKPVPPPLTFSERELGEVNQFLGQLLGTMPTRGGAASQVGIKRGMELIAKRAGVDPMTLQANLAEDKATGKQLAETVQRAGAISRLNNTIDLHGKVLLDTVKGLQQTGSPLLNKPLREITRMAVGNPALGKFLIARNAVQREYAYLTAGGAQSRAMLPVTVIETMDHLFRENATPAEIYADLEQVTIEARKESEAMLETQHGLIRNLQTGMAGKAVSGGAPAASPAPAAGGAVVAEKVWDPATQTFKVKQ
jgi:hypothetical protein